jgi:hypothetical protein
VSSRGGSVIVSEVDAQCSAVRPVPEVGAAQTVTVEAPVGSEATGSVTRTEVVDLGATVASPVDRTEEGVETS